MSQWRINLWVFIGSALWILGCTQPIAAQVIPDNTLPAGERSQVSGNSKFQIDGGATRGGNLFHSFQSFSVPTGGTAYFNNTADVQNIFSRVTGGSISNIDGVMRANGTANLFFLNPNGIIFGANASLNIGGSFVATTANAIGFANGELFSSNATQPLPSQLLSVNPNAFFFNQLTPKPIVNQSTFNNTGLQVPPRQNLLLIGGSVELDGGHLTSPGSYVELGGIGGVGTVGLSTAYEDWQLTIPDDVARADVSLSNSAEINVLAGDRGSIAITARNLTLNEKSTLRAGIAEGLGFTGAQAGDIKLDATETINLADGSEISNEVRPGGTGNAGDINITTGSLSLTDGFDSYTYLFSTTAGQGNAGSVNINARDTIYLGYLSDVSTSVAHNYIFNDNDNSLEQEQIGVGNAGNINITTGSLYLNYASGVAVSTAGQGNAGSININARDRVLLDGTLVENTVFSDGIGNVGGINITTGSLSLTNGAILYSDTSGHGNLGSVNINARDLVSLDGLGTNVGNIVYTNAVGNASSINITTGSLSLTNGGVIATRTFGRGNAGSVNINARDTVSLNGQSDFDFPSSIYTQVFDRDAIGQGGDVTISTGSLLLTNGAAVNTANVGGTGNAGRVTIHARDTVQISGTAPILYHDDNNSGDTVYHSGVVTSVTSGSQGDGGDVSLTTGSLSVSDQGRIITKSDGQGKAGNIQIHARDAVSFDGAEATSTLEPGAVGKGGDIDLTARSLSLFNGAQLSATTSGKGDAGNISIATLDAINLSGVNSSGDVSGLFTSTKPLATGNGGEIRVETRNLQVIQGAVLNAQSFSSGRGGDIIVSADTVGLSGGGQMLTTTSSNGHAGDIKINTPDLQLSGATSGLFAGTTSTADAGSLTIQPRGNGQSVRVNLEDGAQISASTSSSGDGGQLTITAPESITLTGNGSIIAAGTSGSGQGGNLNLQAGTLNIQNQAEVTVSSLGTGNAGSLSVDADRIYLNNQGSIRADTTGGGGNIFLRTPLLLLRNGSAITTNATGENIPGGNITIDARDGFIIAVPQENSDISANSRDFRGGRVAINAQSIFGMQYRSNVQTPQSDITATGAIPQFDGSVQVNTPDVDPSSGLVQLPADFVDRSGLIAQGCPANKGNSFTITGRGGLPPLPTQALRANQTATVNWVTLNPQEQRSASVGENSHLRRSKSPKLEVPQISPTIVEATGWVINKSGTVELTAFTPIPTHNNTFNSAIAPTGDLPIVACPSQAAAIQK
ncbi:MAG: filamentous hemagglutinin N-terminal domain-containing protein [Nostoc sp.]|uniref:two-partner secretion domain-containing protein n=1 Tax=Nostoc sp. TaxID=1180 RepID=UPI002FF9FC1A